MVASLRTLFYSVWLSSLHHKVVNWRPTDSVTCQFCGDTHKHGLRKLQKKNLQSLLGQLITTESVQHSRSDVLLDLLLPPAYWICKGSAYLGQSLEVTMHPPRILQLKVPWVVEY